MSTAIDPVEPSALERVIPAVGWLRRYDRSWLSADVVAGVAAGAVVIPQAMAYGTVAGLPVEVGLYTCIVPMITYALLGGSRRMSLSTTSTIVALTGLALTSAGITGSPDDLIAGATTLTFLVGITLLIARVLRLGFLVECVSEAVLIGLKVGVGITIVASQLPALFGIPTDGTGFVNDVKDVVTNLGEANGATVIISVVTLAVLIAIKRWLPRVPGPLIALIGGIAAVVTLNLADEGVDLIPKVPHGLPAPQLPAFEHLDKLLPFAIAIALMAYLESVSVARTTRLPDDPPLDNGQEFVAVGAASVLGSFFQTAPAAGGFSQTMVNSDAGARTQLSELVTGLLAILTALVLSPLLSDLPKATLGAVVVVAVSGLISFTELERLWRISRLEFVVAVLTGVVALFTNLLVGVATGVIMTFYLVLRSLNHPVIVELRRSRSTGSLDPARPEDEAVDGMLILRVEGGLYTVNVHNATAEIADRVAEATPKPTVVVIDASGTADTSLTVIDTFLELDRRLARDGVDLWVAALPTRALDKVRRGEEWDRWVAAGKLYRTPRDAVEHHERQARA